MCPTSCSNFLYTHCQRNAAPHRVVTFLTTLRKQLCLVHAKFLRFKLPIFDTTKGHDDAGAIGRGHATRYALL